MRHRQLILFIGLISLACFWTLRETGSSVPEVYAQQSSAGSADDAGVIRTETRLVLVDSVVTDKKGEYVRDLTQKDFKVWEDGKEQTLTSSLFGGARIFTNTLNP